MEPEPKTDAPASPTPDGAEPPPRGVRLAAAARWLLLLAMASLAAWTTWTFWGAHAQDAGAGHVAHVEDRYYCAMHQQIRSPVPGECPICHMPLVPIPENRRRTHLGVDAGVVGVVPVTIPVARQQLAGIATAPVVSRSVGGTLRAPAVAEAPQTALAEVHVRAPSFLERVAVRASGVHVVRGQTLAWAYSPQIFAAEQELLSAHRTAGGAPSDLETAARRNVELLGVAPGDVDAMLRTGIPPRTVPIRAPMAGYVTQHAAVLGLYAQPETVLYEITDLSHIWIVASVYERDLAHVQRGMPAHFATRDTPDAPLEARVELVEPQVDPTTRTARVRLVLANPSLRLRPGQYGEVVFDLAPLQTLVVPRDAVIDTGEAQYVYVDLGDGQFAPRLVHVGPTTADETEVREGLHVGDRVVARGSFMLDSESRMQASLRDVPTAEPR